MYVNNKPNKCDKSILRAISQRFPHFSELSCKGDGEWWSYGFDDTREKKF